MSETVENTFTSYLGPDFQRKMMWQLLVEPEFAEKILPNLAVDYFDEPIMKRMFIIIYEFFKEYGKVPNLQNRSIQQAINEFKTPNNKIEEESVFSALQQIELWNDRVLNKEMLHDGEIVRRSANMFIKQQEYRKTGEFIIDKTKNGEIKNKHVIAQIEEKFLKIAHIGAEEDEGTEVFENIDRVLRKEFRQTIPTGIDVIDTLTGGGLGKGEIGVILTPSGVGKTTALTKIANTAYECNKNVLQIIFEDTVEQIQRKHFTIWSGVPLSKMDEENKKVKEIVVAQAEKMKGKGRLVIIKMSQENTTMMDVRAWINRHQKKYGFKFDIVVLDYLDCLDSHKKTPDRTEAELVIIKSFEAMASDMDIPAWTALQTNRGGLNAEIVEAFQTGGSIKRLQKAHFFMSVAKTDDQKEANLATIKIIKARFARDGQTFSDCIFDNDKMMIVIEDKRYPLKYTRKLPPGATDEALGRIEGQAGLLSDDKINLIHVAVSDVTDGDTIKDFESRAIGRANEDLVTGMGEKYAQMNENKVQKPVEDDSLIEFDENVPVEKNIVVEVQTKSLLEEASDKVKDVLNELDNPFGWTGETYTTNPDVVEPPEVRIEDVKPPETSPPKEKTEEVKLQNGGMIPTYKPFENTDTVEFDFNNLPLDSEEPEGNGKIVRDMLAKLGANQHVMKKKENKL
ncbi:MAG: DnaB-like helicase C-terminal domain-containing protein [Dehalococcoidia bacterium]|jgi:replicative DNA helicase